MGQNMSHLDLVTLLFVVPLLCIVYSMMCIWLDEHHENREDGVEKHLKN